MIEARMLRLTFCGKFPETAHQQHDEYDPWHQGQD